jgi:hypothetical protein
MKRTNVVKVGVALLAMSLFAERFCFITAVYKAQDYSLLLVLFVIAFNCLFNYLFTLI